MEAGKRCPYCGPVPVDKRKGICPTCGENHDALREFYNSLPKLTPSGISCTLDTSRQGSGLTVGSKTPITDKIIADADACPETRVVFLIKHLANQCKEFEREVADLKEACEEMAATLKDEGLTRSARQAQHE